MKRILMLVTALIMIVAMTPTFALAEETITIKFLHQWAEENRLPYWQNLVDTYNAQSTNIKVQMEAIPNEPYKDKLRVILGGNEVPDLFFTWDGDFVSRFAQAGAILDLTPYLENESDFHAAFNQGLLKTGQVNGIQYGLPVRTCVNFFLYNKEIFAENGINEVPKTWDEFLSLCETLKAGGVVPLAMGNLEAWGLAHYISMLNLRLVPYETYEADFSLEKGEFTDPGYIQALETMLDLQNRGYLNEAANSTPMAMARELFNAGIAAMIQDQVGSFKSYYYDKMGGDTWDIFPMPEFEGAQGNQDMLVGWIDQFVVSKNCKNPEAVIDFLKFFYNDENQAQMTKDLGFISTINSVAGNKELSFEQINKAMDIINQATGLTTVIDLKLHASVASVYQASIQELLVGKTPQDIMKAVQAEAARVIAESD